MQRMNEYTVILIGDEEDSGKISLNFKAACDADAELFGQALADNVTSTSGTTWTSLTYDA